MRVGLRIEIIAPLERHVMGGHDRIQEALVDAVLPGGIDGIPALKELLMGGANGLDAGGKRARGGALPGFSGRGRRRGFLRFHVGGESGKAAQDGRHCASKFTRPERNAQGAKTAPYPVLMEHDALIASLMRCAARASRLRKTQAALLGPSRCGMFGFGDAASASAWFGKDFSSCLHN